MAEKFEVLSNRDAIRKRPGMWIGDTINCDVVFRETIDNSLDEMSKGNAKNIRIFMKKKNNKDFYIVADDSKVGFPLGIASNGKSIPDAAITNINAGTKFEKRDYMVGQNGVGLKATCALSDVFILCINISNRKMKYNMVPKGVERFKDDDKYLILKYEKGIKIYEKFSKELPEELKNYGLENFSTIVYFDPDLTIFTSSEAAIPKNLDYFYAIQKLNNRKFNDMSIKINNKEYEPSFEEYKYSYNVEWVQDPECKNPKVRMLGYFDLNEDIFSGLSSGSVNSLVVPNGVHMKFFENAYKDAFREVFGDCQGSEFMGVNRLNIVLAVEFMFDSQTKVRLTKINDFNIKDTAKLKDALKKIMKENYEEFQQHYAKIINFLSKKVSLNEKQKITNILGDVEDNSEASRRRSLSFVPSNLKDCYSKDRSKCELFICEGKSASAGILRYRSAATQAVLGLRGVPKNCTGSKIEDILEQNKEMRDLCLGLGSGVDKVKNLSKCRYGKIIIAKDSDEDGERICSIILSFFATHMKYLIEDNRIFVAVTPFYIQENKKCIYMGINDKEFNPKKPFKRIKGLGSLDKWTKQTLLDDKTRVLVQITPENMEDAVTLVRDSAPKKELILTSGSLNMEILK